MANDKKNGKSIQLAKVGDPLVAANGDIFDEEFDDEDDLNDADITQPSTPIPYKDYRPDSRSVSSDFRTSTEMLNAASVIFTYTMLGISDTEISSNLNIDPADIVKVRETRAYADVFERVMRELINANSEYIEARIASYSGMALNNIADIAKRSRNTGYRLNASKDLLDRAGHRPQDRNAGASGMNELHIVITDSKDETTKIDLNLKGKSNGHSR